MKSNMSNRQITKCMLAYLLGTLVNPVLGILVGDTTRNLEPPRPCPECLLCGLVVSRPKHHGVTTAQPMLMV